jgi:IS30 family transposase
MAARGQGEYQPVAETILPEKKSLSEYIQNYLNGIAKKLNERPIKTLNYFTLADILKHSVALTT